MGTTEDHLVPPACSIPLNDLVGSGDKTLYSFPGGHIGIYVSSRSQEELAPKVSQWLMERCLPVKGKKGAASTSKKASSSGNRAAAAGGEKAAPGRKKAATASKKKTAKPKPAAKGDKKT